MSADFSIYGALVLAPVALAVAPVVVAGYAVYRGAEAISRRAEERQRRQEEEARIQRQLEQKRRESYYDTMMEMKRQYDQVTSQYERQSQTLRMQMEASLGAISDGFSSQLENAGNLSELTRWVEESESEAMADWTSQREQLKHQFDQEIHSVFQTMRSNLESTQRGIDALRMANQKDARIQSYAESALEQARATVELLRAETSGIPDALADTLRDAERYYASSLYDIAYSKASGVALDTLQRLEQVRTEKLRFNYLLDDVTDGIYRIEESLAAVRTVRFPWSGQMLEEDLSRYEPDLYNGLLESARRLRHRLEQIHYSREVFPVLRQLHADCENLQNDVVSFSKYAGAKMVFAYSENGNAETVADIMQEQNFEMLDSAYEGDIEGNPLHINFKNRVTDEKVTVVLTPQETGVRISVHNYGAEGAYGGNVHTQRAVQQAIESKLGGRGVCQNPGGCSSETMQADLQRVSRQRADDTAARRYARRI